MRVLIACESSAVVRDAFRARGHDAWSCDILPTEGDARWHFNTSVFSSIPLRGDWGQPGPAIINLGWDLMIAHPPCTYLSRAGARWWKNTERQKLADKAADFVFALRDASIKSIAIENPIGQLNQRWRYPDQTIQPWEYGHSYSKATCLWLKGLPKLRPTNVLDNYVPLIRSNVTARNRKGQPQTGIYSGGLVTAKTFQGIADAMAEQWGSYIENPVALDLFAG